MTRGYVKRPFPADTLVDALKLAEAIQDQNNGRPMNRVLLANAIGRKPASSVFRELLSSAFKYGLTIGNEKSESIILTELGTALTKPRTPEERGEAMKRAALKPELFARLYQHYNNGKVPQGDFFYSVLERDFDVPRERCAECSTMLLENGRAAGIIRELQGSVYVILGEAPIDAGTSEESEEQLDGSEAALADVKKIGDERELTLRTPDAPEPAEPSERFIFIGHGKNRTPLDQLEKVLKQFEIPYKVAVDEPQAARPISTKVAEVMRDCHSAVLIFTADEQFEDKEGRAVSRPSENVVYELGAASVLYENRIVIFKEEGVDFPTNFRDIGHIAFEKDHLDSKGLELVRELIALGLLKVQPA